MLACTRAGLPLRLANVHGSAVGCELSVRSAHLFSVSENNIGIDGFVDMMTALAGNRTLRSLTCVSVGWAIITLLALDGVCMHGCCRKPGKGDALGKLLAFDCGRSSCSFEQSPLTFQL